MSEVNVLMVGLAALMLGWLVGFVFGHGFGSKQRPIDDGHQPIGSPGPVKPQQRVTGFKPPIRCSCPHCKRRWIERARANPDVCLRDI